MKHSITTARILLGGLFLTFGLNYFLKFLPVPPAEGLAAQFIEPLAAPGQMVALFRGRLVQLMAHAFVAGGTPSESERPLTVGGSGQVGVGRFRGFDYVAFFYFTQVLGLSGSLAGMAIAASVAALAILVIQPQQGSDSAQGGAQLTAFAPVQDNRPTQLSSVAPGGVQGRQVKANARARLNSYLVNYNEYKTNSGFQGMLPHARTVTYENNGQ